MVIMMGMEFDMERVVMGMKPEVDGDDDGNESKVRHGDDDLN